MDKAGGLTLLLSLHPVFLIISPRGWIRDGSYVAGLCWSDQVPGRVTGER